MIRVFFVIFGVLGLGATLDVPFDLGRPAGSFGLLGVDLAVLGAAANPAALNFSEGWSATSTYAAPFGLVQVWAFSLAGPRVFGEAVVVDGGDIGPDLGWRVWAIQAGGGLRLGPWGLGARLRLLRPIRPKEALGWSVDLGLFWPGPLSLGAVARAVLSSYPGESWPTTFSVALAFPLDFLGISGFFGGALLDLPVLPRWSVAVEANFSQFSLRGSLGPSAANLGGGLSLPWFALDWTFTLHPDLPLSFRVSFTLRWR